MASRDHATTAGAARGTIASRPVRGAAHSPAPWRVEGSVLDGNLTGKIISFGLNDHGDGPAGYVMRAMEISPEDAALVCAAPDLLATLKAIEDESVFNQQRFAEDDDTDYFLRCFRAVKERCRAAIAKATGAQ